MKTLKLHTALKLKNRLVGEQNRLQQLLIRENCRRNDSTSTVDRGHVENDLTETTNKLVALKSAIAVANVEIYPNLAAMEELKSKIVFLQTIPVREGEEIVPIGRNGETKIYTWSSFFKTQDLDKLKVTYQKQIDDLQDIVDTYNATKTIEVDI